MNKSKNSKISCHAVISFFVFNTAGGGWPLKAAPFNSLAPLSQF